MINADRYHHTGRTYVNIFGATSEHMPPWFQEMPLPFTVDVCRSLTSRRISEKMHL